MRTRVHARRDTHDSFEVPREMALIRKPYGGSHLHAMQPLAQQLARSLDAHMKMISVRRKPKLPREATHQMKPAECRSLCQFIQRDQFMGTLLQNIPSAFQ